jgi:hypothetical protein
VWIETGSEPERDVIGQLAGAGLASLSQLGSIPYNLVRVSLAQLCFTSSEALVAL